MNQPLDRSVLQRAKAGDPAAFRLLYEHCAEGVYRFLHRMLGDAAAAEDALQETFLRVLGALRRFDPDGPAPLASWILTIARRVALSREVSGQRARRRDQVVFEAASANAPPDETGSFGRRCRTRWRRCRRNSVRCSCCARDRRSVTRRSPPSKRWTWGR